MLKKELTKLNDENMKKVHLRAKRLEQRRKQDIIGKELFNFESVQGKRQEMVRLKNVSYVNTVKSNILKEDISKTMDAWAQTGFSKVPVDGNLDLIQQMVGNKKAMNKSFTNTIASPKKV